MNKMPAVAGFPCDIPAKKRRYSSTAVGFPIRNDLSAYSQGISERFPTWMRTRRAPTYVRGLVIDNKSTSNHLPQDHTTRSNHLSDTTRSTLKQRTKPYPAPCQDQSNTRLSTPLRALIFAQIHPIFVEIHLGFAWDSLEVVHNQFNTHSTQLAYSFKPTESSLTNRVSTIESSLVNRVSIIESSLVNRVSTIESKINRITLHDYLTSPSSPLSPRHQADSTWTNQRHQADSSTTPSRPINDTNPTNQGHQSDQSRTSQRPIKDITTANRGHHEDQSRTSQRPIEDITTTNQGHHNDSTWTNQGHHKDTNPTHPRHHAD